MESQGSSRQPEDQLQGIAVQDQELQPVTPTVVADLSAASPSAARVVVRLGDRIIKGYIDRDGWADDQEAGMHRPFLLVRSAETGESESISLADAKAVFFVRNFEGANERADLRFHDHLPPPQCLWIRMTFNDGEILEGMIENGSRYVLDPGFLVTPTDPTANNWLIYVPKIQVQRFEVLGLRQRTATKLASLR